MQISQNISVQAYDFKNLSNYVEYFGISTWKLGANVDNVTTFGNPLRSQGFEKTCKSIVRQKLFNLKT